ncbi:MAG: hypothetical protein ACREQN_18735 [Candidatus Binataceae bacterium]
MVQIGTFGNRLTVTAGDVCDAPWRGEPWSLLLKQFLNSLLGLIDRVSLQLVRAGQLGVHGNGEEDSHPRRSAPPNCTNLLSMLPD